jgi:hypothetical protein
VQEPGSQSARKKKSVTKLAKWMKRVSSMPVRLLQKLRLTQHLLRKERITKAFQSSGNKTCERGTAVVWPTGCCIQGSRFMAQFGIGCHWATSCILTGDIEPLASWTTCFSPPHVVSGVAEHTALQLQALDRDLEEHAKHLFVLCTVPPCLLLSC